MGAVKQLTEHAGSAPQVEPGTALTFPARMRDLFEASREQILATLPDRIDADRFIMVALTAITRNEALINCTPASIFLAVMESARIGLFPDNKEAAIIPYKGRAELQPMVQGIVRLMLRSPGLLKVESRAVFEGDDFEFEYGLNPVLRHVPRERSDKLTHAYAVLWRTLPGTSELVTTFEVVGWDDIEKARLTSRAPDSPAWKGWYPEMGRKVAVKRLGKYADLSPEASRAIDLDNLVSGSAWAGREPEGVSPEYANQLVRSQTVAGIDRLKERIGAAAKDVAKAALTGEIAAPPEAAGSGDVATDKDKSQEPPMKIWPAAYVKELITQGLAENEINAAVILNLSPFEVKEPLGKVIRWVTIYRARRAEGLESELAAETATEEYRTSQ